MDKNSTAATTLNRQQRRAMEREDAKQVEQYNYLCVPIQVKDEYIRLFGEVPVDIIDKKHVGIFLTPHDLARGLARWIKEDSPDPMTHGQTLADVVNMQAVIKKLDNEKAVIAKEALDADMRIEVLDKANIDANKEIADLEKRFEENDELASQAYDELARKRDSLKGSLSRTNNTLTDVSNERDAIQKSMNLQKTNTDAKTARVAELENTLGSAFSVISAYTSWLESLNWFQGLVMKLFGVFGLLHVPEDELEIVEKDNIIPKG